MKVSELIGVKLDYWVAMAEGWEVDPLRPVGEYQIRIKHALTHQASHLYSQDGFCYALCGAERPYSYSPSTNWTLAGPLIEREKIGVTFGALGGLWHALVLKDGVLGIKNTTTGPTPLVAAMRAYVASKYGEEVPEE